MSRFINALLTRDRRQRVWLVHTALAAVLMAAAVILMQYMTRAGLNDGRGLGAWTTVSLAGVVMMFLLVRSGWSKRLNDPSLTVPQMVYSIGCAAAAYAIAGQGQGATLLMLTVALMFGVFGMSRPTAWRIGAYTIVTFGAVMSWSAYRSPAEYPVPVQVAHFGMTCVFVVGFLVVADRLGSMRARMRVQRAELAAALDRISQMATLDELTGLANRRQMSHLLEVERERSARSRHSWSVAILDIDYFKRVNDHLGHAAGDLVLRSVAATGSATIRRCDALARWGGEEFVLLLRDVDAQGAMAMAERLRSALEASVIVVDGSAIGVTGSIGIAAHVPGEPVDATMSRADRALYAAKAGGRNRVVSEATLVAAGLPAVAEAG